MAGHALDRQIGIDRLADDFRKVKNEVSELRTLQRQGTDAVNIQVTGNYSSTIASIATGDTGIFFFTLTPSVAQPIFSTFHFTLYQGSVSAGNAITGNTILALSYDWKWWRDWGDSDNQNVKDYVLVKNNTGSTQTVIMMGNWRYVVNGGTASVS